MACRRAFLPSWLSSIIAGHGPDDRGGPITAAVAVIPLTMSTLLADCLGSRHPSPLLLACTGARFPGCGRASLAGAAPQSWSAPSTAHHRSWRSPPAAPPARRSCGTSSLRAPPGHRMHGADTLRPACAHAVAVWAHMPHSHLQLPRKSTMSRLKQSACSASHTGGPYLAVPIGRSCLGPA